MTVRFSILTPVYNTPEGVLRECIDSVLCQQHRDWELILVDDASPSSHVRQTLAEYSAHPRIQVHHRPTNGGIVAASNDALAHAAGDYVALLDHDDPLTPSALAAMAAAIEQEPQVDYLYSDEDKIDGDGRCFDRFNKPDWSPQRLRGQNYCTHLSVFRTSLMRSIGGFRDGFDGSQDYDIILRATEAARHIVHIPEVLYHWRVVEGSAAGDTEAKPYAYPAAHRAVSEHLERCQIDADLQHDDLLVLQMRPRIRHTHSVSVVIPTCGTRRVIRGRSALLVENCIRSIATAHVPEQVALDIVVVTDRRLSQDDVDAVLTAAPGRVRIVWHDEPFNFSEHVNRGVVSSDADIVIVMNDDTEVVSPDWLTAMIPYLEESDVAVVAPRLLYDDGTIQSAGHYTDLGVHHAAAGWPRATTGRFGILAMAAERSSVMFACAALRRDVFDMVGGLCELFPSSYNDIDYCHKVRHAGYRVIWTPHADVTHYESSSRDTEPAQAHLDLLNARWGSQVAQTDPYLRAFAFELAGIVDYGTYEQVPVELRGRQPASVPAGRYPAH